MGNALDRRAHFDGGYIYVKTYKSTYFPGEKVQGKIYVRTMVSMEANHLEIKIKGKEKSGHNHY